MGGPSDLLGVAPGSPPEEIRRAFASAMRQVHPDAGVGHPDAGERIARLIEARDELLAGAPAPSYRSLTRLQRAARVLGRLLYVSPHN